MLYGRKCHAPICWDQVGERVIKGLEMIEVTNEKFVVAKEKLKEARSRQKSYADKHCKSLEFQPGDCVFLKVSPARGVRRFGIKGKLSPRFIGPFEILDLGGEVSYRLVLPPQLSYVHNVFHVSLLRGYKYHPLHVISYSLDRICADLSYVKEPEAILDRQDRVMKKKTIPFVKILWRNHPEREATWETEEFFGGTIPSGKPLQKLRSLSGLLILISFHDLKDTLFSNASAPTFAELFEINDLKAHAQAKDTVILNLKEKLNSLNGDVKDRDVIRMVEESETLNIELGNQEKILVITALKEQLDKLRGKAVITEAISLNSINPKLLKVDVTPVVLKLRKNRTAHINYIRHTQGEAATLRKIVEIVLKLRKNRTAHIDYIRHTQGEAATLRKIVERINLASSSSGSMSPDNTKNNRIRQTQKRAKKNKVEDHLRNVKSSLNKASVVNLKVASSVLNSVSNVNSNLNCASSNGCFFSDNNDTCVNANSGCSKHMTGDHSQLINFVQKFLGTVKFGNDYVAKIIGYGDYQIGNVTISQVYYVEGLGRNLFSVGQFCDSDLEVAFCQHTCFIRNLEGVNLLTARQGLVRGLPKLKFEKDHLCSACAMGKSTKKTHKPKSEDTNQEKLYLLHMDLCGLMRVESVRLNVLVQRIRTDNGTEFVNQTLRDYYEEVGISHETSVARSPQQNGVVKRRNRTLIEAARTMLIYAQAPLFLWAEDVATACVTQNRSIIRLRHGKTPYELMHGKQPDLSFFHVFGALCYPTNYSENVVDQDAPLPSKSPTPTEIQSLVILQDDGNDNLDIEVAHMGNDPLLGVPIPDSANQ
nr:putative nucleotidyltransferase, ribonuclease H [Tanacetum cinerariifolium]